MIASAGALKSFQMTNGATSYLFFKKQLLYAVLGFISLGFLSNFNYHKLKKIVFPFLILSFILLILVFIPGIGYEINGSQRWIKIGSFTLQATDAAKLAFILYLSAWFEKKGKHVKDFYLSLVPFLIITGLLSILVILEPDLGTLGVIILSSLAIYFVAGGKLNHFLLLFIGGMTAFWTLVKIAPYRLNRVLVFLNPDLDPKGIGYQINQALLAIGSGGILGLGLGYSRQKYNYLPEPINDSIFAIIGEELGLIGTTLIIALFIFLAFRGFKIAQKAQDTFGKLLATGITFWLVLQAFFNIGGIIAIIPLTGITLPFVSFGGTSLLFTMSAIGILLNISKFTENPKSPKDLTKKST
jgi:cell division protein FtsW